MAVITEQLFKIGDIVPESGAYVCVPCGFIQNFSAGERFTACLACLAGTSDGPEGYKDDEAEFWQFAG